jgi:hypothetical protein
VDNGPGQAPTSAEIRPDWYPDPYRRYEYRYHNGQVWTADVSHGGTRGVDPWGTAVSPPTAFPNAVAGGYPVATRPGRGIAIVSLVFGIVAVVTAWLPFVAFLGLGAAITAIATGLVAKRRGAQGGAGRGMATAGLVMGAIAVPLSALGIYFTVLTYREFDAYVNPGLYDVTVTSCTSDDRQLRMQGTLVNRSGEVRSYTLAVQFVMADQVVREATVRVDDVGDAKTSEWFVVEFVGTTFTTDDVDCRVVDVFGPEPFGLETTR